MPECVDNRSFVYFLKSSGCEEPSDVGSSASGARLPTPESIASAALPSAVWIGRRIHLRRDRLRHKETRPTADASVVLPSAHFSSAFVGRNWQRRPQQEAPTPPLFSSEVSECVLVIKSIFCVQFFRSISFCLKMTERRERWLTWWRDHQDDRWVNSTDKTRKMWTSSGSDWLVHHFFPPSFFIFFFLVPLQSIFGCIQQRFVFFLPFPSFSNCFYQHSGWLVERRTERIDASLVNYWMGRRRRRRPG